MNVLTVPKYLTRDRAPTVPPLPTPQPREASPETTAFLDSVTRQREENAYLRAELENVTRENKLAHERIRMLETELTEVRADRDFLTRHDASMLTSLRDIKALIVMAEERAKAEAYAPPGSGQQDHSQQGDELAAGVADLAAKLAPETRTDA